MGEKRWNMRAGRSLALVMPMVLIGAVSGAGWLGGGGGDEGGRRVLAPREASMVPLGVTFRGGSRPGGGVRRPRTTESRAAVFDALRLRVPATMSDVPGGSFGGTSGRLREITIEKSSEAVYDGIDFGRPRREWRHLSAALRREIDVVGSGSDRWHRIVVHNSSTPRGNARALDYYHRHVKGLSEGLAYHFVIGNGTYSGEGEIEVGDRWRRQLAGGGIPGDGYAPGTIEICLVGDFDAHRVADGQLEALDELIDYLEARAGELEVTTHRHRGRRPDGCPGRFFPESLVMASRERAVPAD